MVANNYPYALARLADTHHLNVVLVGSGHQLSAVRWRGMFDCLVTSHTGEVQRVGVVQRFDGSLESDASLELQHGRIEALDIYDHQQRFTPARLRPAIPEGETAEKRRCMAKVSGCYRLGNDAWRRRSAAHG